MNPSPLWDRAVIVGTIHSQICVIRIFRQLSKWERLEHLLRAILTSEAARTFAIAELGDWNSRFNRTFTTLTPAQHSTLRSLLVQARALLCSGITVSECRATNVTLDNFPSSLEGFGILLPRLAVHGEETAEDLLSCASPKSIQPGAKYGEVLQEEPPTGRERSCKC